MPDTENETEKLFIERMKQNQERTLAIDGVAIAVGELRILLKWLSDKQLSMEGYQDPFLDMDGIMDLRKAMRLLNEQLNKYADFKKIWLPDPNAKSDIAFFRILENDGTITDVLGDGTEVQRS